MTVRKHRFGEMKLHTGGEWGPEVWTAGRTSSFVRLKAHREVVTRRHLQCRLRSEAPLVAHRNVEQYVTPTRKALQAEERAREGRG